jgi:VWFA-related protein
MKVSYLGFLLLALTSTAQETAPTFRSNSRLVLVDLILRERSGKTPDISASDVEILEDGKRQEIKTLTRISSFSAPVQQTSALTADVYSNEAATLKAPSSPPVVVMLDILNTPSADRERARTAMLAFLKTQLRPGQQVAIVSLGYSLLLLQGFTADEGLLAKASQNRVLNAADPNRKIKESDQLEQIQSLAGDQGGYLQHMIEVMKKTEDMEDTARTSNRVEITLRAMQAVARMVEGIPGRKSLVWVSGGFPFFMDNRAGITNFEHRSIKFLGL